MRHFDMPSTQDFEQRPLKYGNPAQVRCAVYATSSASLATAGRPGEKPVSVVERRPVVGPGARGHLATIDEAIEVLELLGDLYG